MRCTQNVVSINHNCNNEDNPVVLPTAEEISRRWLEIHRKEKALACNQLNIQFPNMYRLVSTSLDEILVNNFNQDYKMKEHFARIYFCADCNFLEDLPRSVTQHQWQTALINTTKLSHLPSTSLYIQINKQTNNKCILVADKARKWSTVDHLNFDGKLITKKGNLTCRLLIYRVPQTFSIQTIMKHQRFGGKITNYKRNADNVILEISDMNIFDDCVKHKALRIDGKLMFHMEKKLSMGNKVVIKSGSSKELTPQVIALLKASSNLSENEIIDLYVVFWNDFPSGRMNKEGFIKYYEEIKDERDRANVLCDHVFAVFDKDHDGTIDFYEFLLAIATRSPADLESHLNYVFEMCDVSGDGHMDLEELASFLKASLTIAGKLEGTGNDYARELAIGVFNTLGITEGNKLNKDQFIKGCKNDSNLRELFGGGH
ncbi:unnamed protein product [Rotaria socialis]|uniref:EF-hand domain-containing protein n=1 Tax=Rotaria socialis TaxID=392032 RepID=A0A821JFL2_9BILA|nr:unnamed protein product [Rotaria socialis]CAF4719958.1 unnamed protein product [Rotaria socialis]